MSGTQVCGGSGTRGHRSVVGLGHVDTGLWWVWDTWTQVCGGSGTHGHRSVVGLGHMERKGQTCIYFRLTIDLCSCPGLHTGFFSGGGGGGGVALV